MNEYILKMKNLTVSRGGRKNVLEIRQLLVRPGELVAVVGPNGAGKSTLLQTINLLQPYHGELELFGHYAIGRDKIMLRRRSAMVFQEMLLVNDTVFNNVALPLRFRGMHEDEIEELVYKALEDFHCEHLAERSALLLSGGETQRVCIARALVASPELLLLDEPFASLDGATRNEMLEEIRNLARERGITVLLVSHNFEEVLHFAERALFILNGRIVQDDRPEFIMRRPATKEIARLVGMDNIVPCSSEENWQGRFIKLNNGIQFLYDGDVSPAISACCLPGDAISLWDGKLVSEQRTWIMAEGLVERIIPGVGTYRILLNIGGQTLSACVPRSQITDDIQQYAKVKFIFNPAEAHLV